MGERLSRWGVGPQITISAGAFAIAAGVVTYAFPKACSIAGLRHPAVTVLALAILVAGVAMWIAGGYCAMRAYNRDELTTSGIFSIVRHPIYSSWIVLILPGLVLLSRSWPLLLTPVVAYAVFKRSIHVEDEYLVKRFGQAYLDYRSRVNEIVPFPRLWHT